MSFCARTGVVKVGQAKKASTMVAEGAETCVGIKMMNGHSMDVTSLRFYKISLNKQIQLKLVIQCSVKGCTLKKII